MATPDEAVGHITHVINGDTFDVALTQHDSRITADSIRIRLADVDSPEISTIQGPTAKEYTTKWLQSQTVYLDFDDKRGTDPYGRWVTEVYLQDLNGTLKNFNRMLVDSGYACIWDFSDNEFKPADWWGGNIPATASIKSDSSASEPIAVSSSPSSTGEQFVGSVKSNKYHYPSCQWDRRSAHQMRSGSPAQRTRGRTGMYHVKLPLALKLSFCEWRRVATAEATLAKAMDLNPSRVGVYGRLTDNPKAVLYR